MAIPTSKRPEVTRRESVTVTGYSVPGLSALSTMGALEAVVLADMGRKVVNCEVVAQGVSGPMNRGRVLTVWRVTDEWRKVRPCRRAGITTLTIRGSDLRSDARGWHGSCCPRLQRIDAKGSRRV